MILPVMSKSVNGIYRAIFFCYTFYSSIPTFMTKDTLLRYSVYTMQQFKRDESHIDMKLAKTWLIFVSKCGKAALASFNLDFCK